MPSKPGGARTARLVAGAGRGASGPSGTGLADPAGRRGGRITGGSEASWRLFRSLVAVRGLGRVKGRPYLPTPVGS